MTQAIHDKKGKSFILMGVSSTGKTSIGTALAQRFGIKLIDGDDLHPRTNIIKIHNQQQHKCKKADKYSLSY